MQTNMILPAGSFITQALDQSSDKKYTYRDSRVLKITMTLPWGQTIFTMADLKRESKGQGVLEYKVKGPPKNRDMSRQSSNQYVRFLMESQ